MKPLRQPSKEAFCCFAIPPRLNEDVEHDVVSVHGAPKIMPHTLDPDEHLIEVPRVASLADLQSDRQARLP